MFHSSTSSSSSTTPPSSLHAAVVALLSGSSGASSLTSCSITLKSALRNSSEAHSNESIQVRLLNAVRKVQASIFLSSDTPTTVVPPSTSAAAASSEVIDSADDILTVAKQTPVELESLWIDIESMHQYYSQLANSSSSSNPITLTPATALTLREYTHTLYRLLLPSTRTLHDVILSHLNELIMLQTNVRQEQHQLGPREEAMRLVREYMTCMASIPHDPSIPFILTSHQHQHLSTSSVMQLLSETLKLEGVNSQFAQDMFQQFLPFFVIPLAITHVVAPSSIPSSDPFSSFLGSLYRHILPFYLASSASASAQVAAAPLPSSQSHHYLHTIHTIILSADLRRLNGVRTIYLPIYLAFLIDHFDQLVTMLHECDSSAAATSALVATASESSLQSFYNRILMLSLLGLSSPHESLCIKQCLTLLVRRARMLYANEPNNGGGISNEEEGKNGKKKRVIMNGKHSNNKTMTAASSASISCVHRHTTFPDYTLSNWLAYEHIFLIFLNNYELHLIRDDFNKMCIGEDSNGMTGLINEHERWYSDSLRGHQPFTPDFFLELLIRFALTHENPYVRRHVYQTICMTLVQGRKRVRWSKELMFGDEVATNQIQSSNVTSPSASSPSFLALFTSPTSQCLLPSKSQLRSFWLHQFSLITDCEERMSHLKMFIHSLIHVMRTTSPTPVLYLDMYLNVIVDVGSTMSSMIPWNELFTMLQSLSHLISLSSSSSSSSTPSSSSTYASVSSSSASSQRTILIMESLAWILIKYADFDSMLNPKCMNMSVSDFLNQLSQLLYTIVPSHLLQSSHAYYQLLSSKLNQHQHYHALVLQIFQTFFESSTSLPVTDASFESVHQQARLLVELLRFLPVTSETVAGGHEPTSVIKNHFISPILTTCTGANLSHGTPRHYAAVVMLGKLLMFIKEHRCKQGRTKFHQVVDRLDPTPCSSSSTLSITTTPPCALSCLDTLLAHEFSSHFGQTLLTVLSLTLSYESVTTSGNTPLISRTYLRGVSTQVFRSAVEMYHVNEYITTVLAKEQTEKCAAKLLEVTSASDTNQQPQLTMKQQQEQLAKSLLSNPLLECKILQNLHVMFEALEASPSYASSSTSATSLPVAPATYLPLLHYLSTSQLSIRLSKKSLYTGSPIRYDIEPNDVKTNYVIGSQVVRWRIMKKMLEMVRGECSGEHGSDFIVNVLHSSSASSTSSSVKYSYYLFTQPPSYLLSLLSLLTDALSGSTAESWPFLIECVHLCIELLVSFARHAEAFLMTSITRVIAEEHQKLLLGWRFSEIALHSALPPVYDAILQSFYNDISRQSNKSTNRGSESEWQFLGWNEIPQTAHSVVPSMSSSEREDHIIPHVYSALVECVLDPQLFRLRHLHDTPTLISNMHLYAHSLLAHAIHRHSSTLLYALTLQLITLTSTYPRECVIFLPELTTLLMLEKNMKHENHISVEREEEDTSARFRSFQQQQQSSINLPIEQLIRVMILSLLEQLTKAANRSSATASATSDTYTEDAYYFITHALHYFIHLNFHHSEYAMNMIGGEKASGGGDTASAATEQTVPSELGGHSSAHHALTALWHGLCVMSSLRLKLMHCVKAEAGEFVGVVGDEQEDASAQLKPKQKYKQTRLTTNKASQKSSSPSSSSSSSPAPIITPLPPSYPLLSYIHSHTFILLISPSLTSSLRHLLEVFLINVLSRHIESAEDPTSTTLLQDSILMYLERTIYKQNVCCSLLVIIGFICSRLVKEEWHRMHHCGSSAAATNSLASLIHLLFTRIHIWTQSSHGQVRTIAQYFYYNLFFEVYHSHLFFVDPITGVTKSLLPKGMKIKAGLSVSGVDTSILPIETDPVPLTSAPASTRSDILFTSVYHPLFLFLYRSASHATLREKQDAFFREFRPFERVSVEGLVKWKGMYQERARSEEVEVGHADGKQVDNEETESTRAVATATASSSSNSSSPLATLFTHLHPDLPTEDLLHYLRSVTSAYLNSLQEEREWEYYSYDSVKSKMKGAGNVKVWQQSSSASESNATSSSISAAAPTHNFQQKIAPLKSALTDVVEHVLDSSSSSSAATTSTSVDSLDPSPSQRLPPGKHMYLCASLVSKGVNLGGLCRTAEIMSCSLVVSSTAVLEDATFQNVSSTASKWVDVSVVARDALRNWLKEMKRQGYTIMGLEQTVHSTPLQSTHFPDRVVLVLGDEKRGVPAEILNLLDQCIVIPQFGLIRSLNVHVSAGMVVWEYVKQCMNGQSTTTTTAE